MKKISLSEPGIETLYGARDANLKHIESLLNVQIRTHGGEVTIDGDPKNELRAQQIFKQLKDLIDEGYPLANGDGNLQRLKLLRRPESGEKQKVR